MSDANRKEVRLSKEEIGREKQSKEEIGRHKQSKEEIERQNQSRDSYDENSVTETDETRLFMTSEIRGDQFRSPDRSSSSSFTSSQSDAFLPSTPSSIPLIDDSPNVDMTKRSYDVTGASSSASHMASPTPKPFQTPSMPHIRSLSTGAGGGGKLPTIKGRQGIDRSASLKPTLEILPTPMSSSSSSGASTSFSTSMLLTSSQKSSSLHRFRYTTLWNGAVAALKENVAIKRRKKMGGFALLSSATGTMDIFSGRNLFVASFC